jgi:hypothetical protein
VTAGTRPGPPRARPLSAASSSCRMVR